MGKTGAALINRDFAKLWHGQAVSRVGDFVFDTTLVLWIATELGKGRSWAPAAVSGVLIAAAVATLAVGPLAGVFVDRWNRRRTMLRTDAFRGVLVGGLAALAFLPSDKLPLWAWLTIIYVVVLGVNAAGMFFGPARMATIADVVSGDAERAKAAGITQSTEALAGIIGPPLAAPLLFAGGVQWAMVVNALSYVVSYAAIRSVATPDTSGGGTGEGSSLRAEFLAGLRFFGKTRVLVVLIAVAMIANFGAAALNTLDVFFTTANLHADAKFYGLIGMAFGIGAIIGGLSAARVVARIGTANAVWATVGTCGLVLLLYARQTSLWAALPVVFLMAVPIAMVNAALEPLLLQVTPREFLGRVIAVFQPANSLVQLLSTVLVGWLMSSVLVGFHAEIGGLHLGPIDSVLTVVGLLFLVSAGYAFLALPRSQAAVTESEPEAEPEAAPA